MGRNAQATQYCEHLLTEDHDVVTERGMRVCLASKYLWDLTAEQQEVIRERDKVHVAHCMCCHRQWVSEYMEEFDLCAYCVNQACGGGVWEQEKRSLVGCDRWHPCTRQRRCREAAKEM